MSLSLCMIVKNEESTLSRCLESVKDIVDEMIIVDTGSTDDTVEIAKRYGAQIFFYKWDNSFANARNYSLSKASKDWILIMDADDELVSEDKDKVINLITNKNNKLNAYFGETLSYSGDLKNYNIYSNLNIRFIKNGKGYKFIGDIHEQIIPGSEDEKKQVFLGIADIRFYHYGYLNETVIKKNKRKRNMDIIEKILKDNPNNTFMLYNMGVEYSAKGQYAEALNYFKKAYANFNPALGFGSKLILKMISCHEVLGQFDDCLDLIEDGQKYYPTCTEYEFCKANIFFKEKKYLSAIESAKKCLSMGESPILLREVSGVATYKPYYLLATIAFTIGDLDGSYEYFDKALKLNSKLTDAIFKVAEIMAIKNTDISKMQEQLEGYFNDINEDTIFLLSKIFYIQNNFDIAYKYVKKAEELQINSQKIYFYKGLYLFYLGNFREALKNLYNVSEGEYYNTSIYCSILCELLTENYKQVDVLLKIIEEFNEPEEALVYKAFISLTKENKHPILAKDNESSKKFIKPIFNLLEILLRANCFHQFKKAIQLLNLINDDSIFIRLGKLYYKYGHFNYAYKEFIRSIKTNDKLDIDSLSMMKTILLSNEV